jgi:hypothetical protein
MPSRRAPAKSEPLPTKDHIRRVAVTALLGVAQDPAASAAAIAAAARTLLETLGDIGRLQEIARQAEKPLNEMNARELDEEIRRHQSKKAAAP